MTRPGNGTPDSSYKTSGSTPRTASMLTPEVIAEAQVLLSVELTRLKLLPCGGQLMLGTCSDGLVLVFQALDLSGRKRLNFVRVYEPALRSTKSEILIRYFEDNREGKHTIEDFAMQFHSAYNELAGSLN